MRFELYIDITEIWMKLCSLPVTLHSLEVRLRVCNLELSLGLWLHPYPEDII